MVKTSKVVVLFVALALLAISAFAATPVAQPQLPGATAPMVSTTLVDEIFSPVAGAQRTSAFVTRGVCNQTCQLCFGTCPDFHGQHQSCVSLCP